MYVAGSFIALVVSAAVLVAGCSVGSDSDASFADDPQATRLRVTMLGAERESPGVFAYDLSDSPTARILLTPVLPNRKVTFLAQGKSGGLWLDVSSEVATTNENGQATVQLPELQQGVFRASAHFVGDAANAGVSSSWVYFRIEPKT